MSEPPCYRLPLDRYPGMNPFVLDWMNGDERFLGRNGTKDSGRTAAPPPAELVEGLIASNRKWGLDVREDVRRWAAGGTVTIVAGQQVGFAGGPLYTLAKLATLLRMKRDNEARGVPTTVFFWLATEDHDFDEVAQIALPNHKRDRQTDLIRFRATRSSEPKHVVGNVPVPETLIAEFLAATNLERPPWLRAGITFTDSFAELLVATVREKFILVDALLPPLRRAGAPLLQSIVRRWDDVQREIASRSRALQDAGYAPQVIPRPGDGYSLLFRVGADGSRELMQRPDETVAAENLSTSALTRPLLQNFVLRPDVFVGGPAEVAYCAQIAPLHAMLNVTMPRVALRGHVLPGARAVVRKFARFNIAPEAVFATPESAALGQPPAAVDDVRSVAADAQRELQKRMERIRELALPADHAVARSVNRSIGHIEYHFDKLTERAIRAIARKDRERFDAARELVSTFFPDRHVQDRVVAWVSLWLRFGEPLLARLVGEVEPDAPVFKIVSV